MAEVDVAVTSITTAHELRGSPPADSLVLVVTYDVLTDTGEVSRVESVGMELPNGGSSKLTHVMSVLGHTPGASPNFANIETAARAWARDKEGL